MLLLLARVGTRNGWEEAGEFKISDFEIPSSRFTTDACAPSAVPHSARHTHNPAGLARLGALFATVDVFLAVVVPRRGVFGAARVGRPPVLGHDGLLSEGLSLSDEREHLRRCQVSMTNRQEAYYTEPSELRHIFKDCLYVALAGLRMALFW